MTYITSFKDTMKKFIIISIATLLCLQAFALDNKKVTITITINRPPSVGDVQPKDGDVVNEGDTLTVSITASDPNQDTLLYRFLINNVVKQDWQSGSTWEYQFSSGDIGLNKVKAEVTDGMRTTASDEVEIYVFRGAVTLPQ